MVTVVHSLFINWLRRRVDAKSGRMSELGCEGDGMAEEGERAVGMTACGSVQCKENKHLQSNECACRMDSKKPESPCATPKKLEQSLLSNFFSFGRGNDVKTPESAGKKNTLATPSPPEQKKKKGEDKKKRTATEKTKNGLTTTILSFFTTRVTTGDGTPESPHVSRDYRIGDCIEFKSREPLTPRSFLAKRTKDFAQLSDDSESEDERMRYNIRRAKNLRIADIKEIPVASVHKKGAIEIQSGDDIPSTSTRNEAAVNGIICDKLSESDTTTVSKTDAQLADIDMCDEVSVLSANDSNINTSRDPSRSPSPEVPDGEYEVEEIWDFVKNSKANGLYYVKWKGYGEDENTWEPIENLAHCEDLLYAFYCMRKDEIERGDGFVVEGRGKRKLDMPPDPRPFVRKVREFLNSGSEQQVSEEETQWAVQLIDSGKTNFVWSEQKTEKCMHDATQGKLDETKVSELRQQLVYRHIYEKLSDQKKQLKAWAKQLNSVTKGRPAIEVENKLDFSLPPIDFEYINDYIATDGIIIPDDPPFGCDCDGGCGIGKESCCPVLHGTKFAYRNNKRMLAAYNSYMLYECNKKCKCGPECNNRVVQDGVTPLKGLKLCIFRTKYCGWGVKTLKPIRKGTFVCMYVGEILTTTEAERRGEKYDQEGVTYLFDLDFNSTDCPYTVDARYKGNISHFINHSCDPNLAVFGVWVDCLDVNLPKLALFAERDIEKDEELYFDYKRGSGNVKANDGSDAGLSSENGPLIKRQLCMCFSANCRKTLFT